MNAQLEEMCKRQQEEMVELFPDFEVQRRIANTNSTIFFAMCGLKSEKESDFVRKCFNESQELIDYLT